MCFKCACGLPLSVMYALQSVTYCMSNLLRKSPLSLSNACCHPTGPDTAVPVPAAALVCVNGNPAMTSGSGNNAPTVTGSTPHNGQSKTPQAIVKPQILTHVIEGFVIQEGAEPFPVSS